MTQKVVRLIDGQFKVFPERRRTPRGANKQRPGKKSDRAKPALSPRSDPTPQCGGTHDGHDTRRGRKMIWGYQ